MGLLDNYTGLGMSPRPAYEHQKVIQRLVIGIFSELDERKYEVLPESCLDIHNLNSKAPDVVVYRTKRSYNTIDSIMFIEVTTTNMLEKIIEASIQALKDYITVKEAFVYDYQEGTWLRLYKHGIRGGIMREINSYSPILDIELSQFLD